MSIPMAATMLRDLAHKSREQIQFTSQGVYVLRDLQKRGMVDCKVMSNLPEQNIWMITGRGIDWLKAHGIDLE